MLKKYFNQYINTGILTYLSKQTSFHVNSLFCCFHFKSSEELFPFLSFFFFLIKNQNKRQNKKGFEHDRNRNKYVTDTVCEIYGMKTQSPQEDLLKTSSIIYFSRLRCQIIIDLLWLYNAFKISHIKMYLFPRAYITQ